LIFQHADAILQGKLLPLQSRDLQLVGKRAGLKGGYRIIQIAMFDLQQFYLLPDTVVVHGAPMDVQYVFKPDSPATSASPERKWSAAKWMLFRKTACGKHVLLSALALVSRNGSTLLAASKKEIAVSENHLSALRLKHAELEAQLELEETRPHPDDDLIHRLKKQKLQLKDAMTQEMASA
jgi:hypothetical protein